MNFSRFVISTPSIFKNGAPGSYGNGFLGIFPWFFKVDKRTSTFWNLDSIKKNDRHSAQVVVRGFIGPKWAVLFLDVPPPYATWIFNGTLFKFPVRMPFIDFT